MDFQIIMLIIIAALVTGLVFQQAKVVIAKRITRTLERDIDKERKATADILALSKEVITANIRDEEFLSKFVEYALRTLKGSGAAILRRNSAGEFVGCAIAGIFPPLKDVPSQVEQQLMAHSKKHTEFFRGMKLGFKPENLNELCGDKGFAFFKESCPLFFPSRFPKEAPRMLMAPIKSRRDIVGCIIVISKDDFDSVILSEADGHYLVRLVELASLSMEVIQVFRERKEYEERLQAAREEGMIQVSTGIIHNIGNAITVAKLSIQELQDKLGTKTEDRPETLLINEVLPTIREKVKSGEVGEFLTSDPAGSQYLDIMGELLAHANGKAVEASRQLDSLASKLHHISEIIELQQRFVGELGTENMTQLHSVVESTITIFEETFNKRGFKIKAELEKDTPEVLVDPSMMTQVYMNLIKNAVEAMDGENIPDKDYQLWIRLYAEKTEDKEYTVVEVKDNGPGMTHEVKSSIFTFGFSTKGKGNSRGYGLHSCMDTVRKYGGRIEVKSSPGEGATFKVSLPVKRA
ncbi:MAG: hypothetical protein A2X49_02220 [Lentisphaerae bacterium GWF2_52_8]|nr:MAG: hypothetical protein A2X49_02220 [Lentisphaerae bacterium GWF2_52_8]